MLKNNKHATIQVDLDGLWVNLKYYGYSSDSNVDGVFETSVPRFLELFDKYNVKATFFLIGKDLEIKEKAKLVKEICKAGHEIANHTYSHPFGLRKLSKDAKIKEIKKCEDAIAKITKKMPVGFKAPGYDIDSETLNILSSMGYKYDSSVLPTYVFPFLMMLNRIKSGGVKRTHGPRWNWFMAPNECYRLSKKSEWKSGNLGLIEVPCTVMPIFRLPYHATFATLLGINYFKLGFKLTRFFGLPLNYEFHCADLCDNIIDKRLGHLGIHFEKRYKACKNILETICKDYMVIRTSDMADGYGNRN